MKNIRTRVEKLETDRQPGTDKTDETPTVVVVQADGLYRIPNGETMTPAEFERRYPDANVLRLHGFDNV